MIKTLVKQPEALHNWNCSRTTNHRQLLCLRRYCGKVEMLSFINTYLRGRFKKMGLIIFSESFVSLCRENRAVSEVLERKGWEEK